ncbi:anti-sigma factor [Alcaligenaceae bacterium]|nr:anti-sigma factor [Alcaligenaceae bacterium]
MSSTDISKHNVLIAEYTLGLLSSHDTARAHRLLSESDEAIALALDWEDSLLDLSDVLPPMDPSPLLLQRIQTTLGHDTTPAPSSLYRKPAAAVNGAAHEPDVTTIAADSHTPLQPPLSEQSENTEKAGIPTSQPAGSRATSRATTPQPSTISTDTAEHTATCWLRSRSTPQTPAAPRLEPSFGHSAEKNDSITPPPDTKTAYAPPNRSIATEQIGVNPADRPRTSDRLNDGAAASTTHTTPAPARTDASTHAPAPTPARTAAPAPAHAPTSARAPAPASMAAAKATHDRAVHPGARQPKASHQSVAGNIWVWRAATAIFAGIALVLAVIPSQPAQPPINIVTVAPTQAAILQAPGQTSTPGWVVTFDPQGNVLMKPQVRSDIPADTSVQLWTRSASMPQARSLGLIDPNLPVTVPASLMGTLGEDQLFEMTLEPQGGSPNASPSGPVLFIGQVITFGAPEPAPTTQATNVAPKGSMQ